MPAYCDASGFEPVDLNSKPMVVWNNNQYTKKTATSIIKNPECNLNWGSIKDNIWGSSAVSKTDFDIGSFLPSFWIMGNLNK